MIYEMSRDLDDLLKSWKFPARVVFGPMRMTPDNFTPTIIVKRDDRAPDQIGPMHGTKTAARQLVRTRTIGGEARICVQSSHDGAHRGDHEREAEQYIDAMICALIHWSQTSGCGPDVPFSEARFMNAGELEAEYESWPGVVYLLRFRVARGVVQKHYTGEGRTLAPPIGAFGSQTQVFRTAAGTADTAEVGCDSLPE